MTTETDLAIIGAGPAGMSAAVAATEAGLSVAVLDEQPAPGGQIYRAVEEAVGPRGKILGRDYAAGLELAKAFRASAARHIGDAVVWRVDPDGAIAYSKGGRAHILRGRRVLVATGAVERPTPWPGWTLPGVFTVGAAQILLKQSALTPRDAVLAGSGPLLYLVAQQLIRAGRPPKAILETQERDAFDRAALHLPGALRAWRGLLKGAGMLSAVRTARIPRHRVRDIRIEGEDRVESVSFASAGARRSIDCGVVLLHEGVAPNIQITRALRLDHEWDEGQRCFRPKHDRWGVTSVDTVYVAGDGGGVLGAKAAKHSGRLAALHAACALGKLTEEARDEAAEPAFRALAAERPLRAFIDAAYPPAEEVLAPADTTIVCRCEEVTAGEIRGAAALGCTGPNQTKAFTRCGMGPCQGRYCGLTVTELLAEAHGRDPAEIGYFRLRSPIKPVTLGELASLAED